MITGKRVFALPWVQSFWPYTECKHISRDKNIIVKTWHSIFIVVAVFLGFFWFCFVLFCIVDRSLTLFLPHLLCHRFGLLFLRRHCHLCFRYQLLHHYGWLFRFGPIQKIYSKKFFRTISHTHIPKTDSSKSQSFRMKFIAYLDEMREKGNERRRLSKCNRNQK